MKYVNKPVRKKDAMQLVTGQPVYIDDISEGLPDRKTPALPACERDRDFLE